MIWKLCPCVKDLNALVMVVGNTSSFPIIALLFALQSPCTLSEQPESS